jgi:hypothetical protein
MVSQYHSQVAEEPLKGIVYVLHKNMLAVTMASSMEVYGYACGGRWVNQEYPECFKIKVPAPDVIRFS